MILQDTLSSVKERVNIGFSCFGFITVKVYKLDPRPLETQFVLQTLPLKCSLSQSV